MFQLIIKIKSRKRLSSMKRKTKQIKYGRAFVLADLLVRFLTESVFRNVADST